MKKANHFGLLKKSLYAALAVLFFYIIFSFVSSLAVKDTMELGFASQTSEFSKRQIPNDVNQPYEEDSKKTKKKTRRPDHSHPAFSERQDERNKLVSKYIEPSEVRDPNVLKAMRAVPRHSFVLERDLRAAYVDRPLYIGLGQTISQPYIVAYMTAALQLEAKDKVLEVGTGSGYQAAVCAEIVREVYTIEILEELAESAKERLGKLGYSNVFVKAADGYFGWEEHAPFDAIIVTCAAGMIPPALIEQLKPGGKIIIPLGSPFGSQTLVLLTKNDKGKVTSRQLLPVRFVPMTGRVEK